jgi:hypothetical protein
MLSDKTGGKRKPQRGDSVVLYNGVVTRIQGWMSHGIYGHIVELENGLFIEVAALREESSSARWQEILHPQRR